MYAILYQGFQNYIDARDKENKTFDDKFEISVRCLLNWLNDNHFHNKDDENCKSMLQYLLKEGMHIVKNNYIEKMINDTRIEVHFQDIAQVVNSNLISRSLKKSFLASLFEDADEYLKLYAENDQKNWDKYDAFLNGNINSGYNYITFNNVGKYIDNERLLEVGNIIDKEEKFW